MYNDLTSVQFGMPKEREHHREIFDEKNCHIVFQKLHV